MGLFTGHLAAAAGATMFKFARAHPMRHRRFAVWTHHCLLPRVAHQLPCGFASHHPRRLAPVTHHRRLMRFRVRPVHMHATNGRPRRYDSQSPKARPDPFYITHKSLLTISPDFGRHPRVLFSLRFESALLSLSVPSKHMQWSFCLGQRRVSIREMNTPKPCEPPVGTRRRNCP
jgi:hypothetical protein